MQVRDCRTNSTELRTVLALLKQAKSTVGFLPDQAVEERMRAGTLLVAEGDDGGIVGYVLYDLPKDQVTIRQLVVDRKARRQGIARALVDELVARYGDSHRGIGLSCRRDFDATRCWERLGFVPISERPGRGKLRRRLTYWWKSFNQPDLFTLAQESDERPIAVLDTNLVIGGADGDPEVADQLLTDWLTGEVRLGVAPYTHVELHRRSDPSDRANHMRYAKRFEQIPLDSTTAEALEAAVVEELGGIRANRHRNDIKLAAQAAVGGARWFVTSDRRFRRACAATVRSVAGITVLSPAEMVLAADQLVRGGLYDVRDLLGTDIRVRPVEPGECDALAPIFVNQRAGEALRPWRRDLEELVGQVRDTSVFVFCDGTAPIGLVAVRAGDLVEVPLCRVARVPAEPTLARHVLGWLRDHCIEAGSVGVKITDPSLGPWMEAALKPEGYLPQDQPIAVPMRGEGSIVDVAMALRSPPLCHHVDRRHVDELIELEVSPEGAKSVEAVFDPFVVTGAGLRTVRVPIGPGYASQLFDHSLSAGQLFARDRSVALAREQVYFRTPSARSLLAPPARILWQVTGKRAYGGGTLRGWSLLNDCVVGNVDQLIERFARFGVLDAGEIRSYAKDGQIMALRFSHTRVFTHPITLDRYRGVMRELEPGKGLTHAGPQPVTEQMFTRLRGLGT